MGFRDTTSMLAQGRESLGDVAYERHQPEQTLLYQLVEAHYPALVDQLAQQGKSLPDHVHREFESYLKCGRLENGLLRLRCDNCHFERLALGGPLLFLQEARILSWLWRTQDG